MGALPTAAFNLIVTGNLLRERRRFVAPPSGGMSLLTATSARYNKLN
jgi:hypothetical protein